MLARHMRDGSFARVPTSASAWLAAIPGWMRVDFDIPE